MTELLNSFFGTDLISFRYPYILNGLYFLPVLFFSAFLYIVRNSRLLPIIDGHPAKLRNALQTAAALIAAASFITALAEPYGVNQFRKPVWKGEVVDFVVDLSLSQNSDDIKPSRLEAEKKALLEAADMFNKEGITTLCLAFFTVRFNRLLECTPDIDNFKAIAKRLDTDLSGGLGGTNLLAAIPIDYDMIRKEVIPKNSRVTLFLITDGGKEMVRNKLTGAVIVSEPDWQEDELQKKVTELSKSGVRIIPVGIGGVKPAPVIVNGETYYTQLDEKIIKKIAMWSGAPERYFIVREGADFGKWISDQVLMNREVDYYRDEPKETGLWRYPLLLGICFASAAFGALGFARKITPW
ncbi:hypothetical protein A2924_03715 [Candidatus Giovannonibacteria bacterium RIFCSPLOWO2_01_FULL_44_16]|uniref:VWFA domain-containing protein n=1 Tax=Candidatus Giovannonibacteria bacterium RIFCSPLOWO2_01_FULL_44_16 TaxID=1798348 RepID=A0A1F5X2C7_9BACT|nr:MAG: hypothetical protein A2924_03715 [Candidatus Giovannonibacteria bacterium RIFCSPLOWO2_01_FULL_44_16]